MILKYTTSRLLVFKISSDSPQVDLSLILENIVKLLTPKVTENLPPYFRKVNSIIKAHEWLKKTLSEGDLYLVEMKATKTEDTKSLVGFIFTNREEQQVHIGYLLGEAYWRKGLASELLKGFIDFAKKEQGCKKIIGGVDINNHASAKLLTKLGFVAQPDGNAQVVFYEYIL